MALALVAGIYGKYIFELNCPCVLHCKHIGTYVVVGITAIRHVSFIKEHSFAANPTLYIVDSTLSGSF